MVAVETVAVALEVMLDGALVKGSILDFKIKVLRYSHLLL